MHLQLFCHLLNLTLNSIENIAILSIFMIEIIKNPNELINLRF
ncbi:MAG: hypothetical protein K0R36_3957 [Chryseobacterium sp.]|jgi:hypothetical protein|nr:hypothetical protein [Chryseobacterium sp.]